MLGSRSRSSAAEVYNGRDHVLLQLGLPQYLTVVTVGKHESEREPEAPSEGFGSTGQAIKFRGSEESLRSPFHLEVSRATRLGSALFFVQRCSSNPWRQS